MRSTLEETFNVAKVREIISKVLQDVLTGKRKRCDRCSDIMF